MLHCAFPCRPNFFFVSGQLAFLQSTPFFLVFGVIHHLDLECTGFEPFCIFSACCKQFLLSPVHRLCALRQTVAKVLADDICLFQADKLLPIAGNADGFSVFLREFLVQNIFDGLIPLVFFRQDLIFQLMDAVFQLPFLHIFRIFFLIECKDLFFQLFNDAPLLIQPEQIQLGKLIFDFCDSLDDRLDALVVLLLLRHIDSDESLGKKRLLQAGQLLLERLPMPQLFLQTGQFLFQMVDAELHRTPPDEGVFHPALPKCAGHIALIQHSLCRNCRLIAAQLFCRVAAYHPTQKIVHIAACQLVFCLHLFCQTAGQRSKCFFFPQFSDIYQTKCTVLCFLLQPVVNVKCILITSRLHQQIIFLVI